MTNTIIKKIEEMKENKNLPQGWVECELKDLGEIVAGGTPSTSDPENFNGEIAWLTPADLSKYDGKYITKGDRNLTEKGLKTSSAKLMPAGSILFSSRAPIGYVVIASNEICTNQGFKNIVPSMFVFNEYIYYYLKASKNLAEKHASGTTFKEISGTKFGSLPIPLPPLAEQKRIVDKIEELFSDIDAGVKNLEDAKLQIKQYRQSVLKQQFSIADYPEITLKEVTFKINDGTHFTPTYIETGVPFLSVKDLRDKQIFFDDCKYISAEEHKALYNRCNPELGDVLITKSGTIGRTAIVKTNKKFSLFVSVALLKPNKDLISSEFLMYALDNYISKIDIKQNVKGGVIKNLHLEDIRKIKINLPDLKKQNEIVEEIEKQFGYANDLEQAVDEGLEKAKQLKQSILKKAFEGKLVPQNSTDEPASILLEKIKAERAK